ncbi:MAG: histidine phosphatase family protein, partial [Microlunatus sp.]|nr:histidine phosphatase family protein [Microlunatus sp.]
AHAEPPTPGQSDLDRPLSAEGNAEAEAAGRWLHEQKLVPDLALCSSARRTRETLESAAAGIVAAIADSSAGLSPEVRIHVGDSSNERDVAAAVEAARTPPTS